MEQVTFSRTLSDAVLIKDQKLSTRDGRDLSKDLKLNGV